jgi:hypothetical protein
MIFASTQTATSNSILCDLRAVLDKLRFAGLTANAAKCHFAADRLSLLGHVIDGNRLRPGEDKLAAVQGLTGSNMKTKTHVRAALGLFNFFRAFIPKMAEVALPLTALLKKSEPDKVKWDEKCETALEKLKTALLSEPCLIAPDFNRQFHLFTDSSKAACGSALCQRDDKGLMHPIAFSSHKLTPSQIKWSIVEKELFALYKAACITFRHYLLGATETTQVYSDHRPLAYLSSITDLSPRLTRWGLMLQELNLKTSYIPGPTNAVADALSRL